MFTRLLIANRGEIAARIIRTARRLGIETVLAVSEADRRSLAAGEADEVVLIGPPPAADSYLRGDRIIEAARQTGCQAIHPGYGFLSENADFVEAVTAACIRFVGPQPSSMRRTGSKAAAKALAISLGIPVVPGYHGERQDLRTLKAEARKIGYPVLIKAVDGGGGRGMRLLEREDELAGQLESAQREAKVAFGSERILLEKLVVRPRHVEVQVFGDGHGNVVHLFERDCTLQRRNQKVIEEAPAPGMSAGLRARLTEAAVSLACAVAYESAGTVEFLVEGGTLGPDAPFYFIEINTRLQVEHPVTEAVTGLDLVEWQLRVAAGEPLPLRQDEIAIGGHAIEVRVNAEDPAAGFLPSIGEICRFEPGHADGIRIETGVASGARITPYYDSMIAKIIAAAPDRDGATAALRQALERTVITGIRTNMGFLHALLGHPGFRAAALDTGLIAREQASLTAHPPLHPSVWSSALEALLRLEAGTAEPATPVARSPSPWAARDAFQLGPPRRLTLPLLMDGSPVTVEARWTGEGVAAALAGEGREPVGPRHGAPPYPCAYPARDRVHVLDRFRHIELRRPAYDSAPDADSGDSVRAPINGRVAKVLVRKGDKVEKGDRLAIVEAMKMEHVLYAPRAGTIARIAVGDGQQVEQGALLVALG